MGRGADRRVGRGLGRCRGLHRGWAGAGSPGRPEVSLSLSQVAAQQQESATTQKAEREVSRMVVVMVGSFCMCYVPYAALAMYMVNNREHGIDLRLVTIPAFFSKSSCVYNPIIYCFMNKQVTPATPGHPQTQGQRGHAGTPGDGGIWGAQGYLRTWDTQGDPSTGNNWGYPCEGTPQDKGTLARGTQRRWGHPGRWGSGDMQGCSRTLGDQGQLGMAHPGTLARLGVP